MAAYAERLRECEAQQRVMAELIAKQGAALRELGRHVSELVNTIQAAAQRNAAELAE
ncbi:hypothetical protein C7416_103584 [Cupriavidus phytorum]|uniref:Uncharacterized protein n=1 Tax=Cupriavidus phytorum TaxID=3024399 RepID=A0A2W7P463_9BURK|nr:hypothetical protein [Cupriavidus alkaliphilus]PZX30851.1 hypothetical protein C7416_103584 [Cupriavidus alkaliphilus]